MLVGPAVGSGVVVTQPSRVANGFAASFVVAAHRLVSKHERHQEQQQQQQIRRCCWDFPSVFPPSFSPPFSGNSLVHV